MRNIYKIKLKKITLKILKLQHKNLKKKIIIICPNLNIKILLNNHLLQLFNKFIKNWIFL